MHFAAVRSWPHLPRGSRQGAYIQGIVVKNQTFAGDPYAILSGFSIVTSLGLLAGYSLLGATWLILKTGGTTQAFARFSTRPALIASLIFLLIISIWTPLDHRFVAQRWFSAPDIWFLWVLPLLTLTAAWFLWRSLATDSDSAPFAFATALFVLALLGLGITLWPYAVLYSVTLWDASSSVPTQEFLAVGTIIILPVILAYLAYAHWVFRGKATPRSGYGAAE
ncbi:MAG TPA: cytochrome d ubiquinol oxidase subunit II [Micropepsaceae bacterium]|nr:cytochrome d ubiquinol oxidase subunit II [Micropepsaceae bacterium]